MLEQRGRPEGVCRVAGGTGSSWKERKTGSSRWGTPCLTYRVDFSGCVRQGAPFFLRCFLQFTNLQISDSIYATELSFTRKRFTTQQIRRMGFLIEKNKAFNRIFR